MNLEPELTADEAEALASLTAAGAVGVMDVTVTEADPYAEVDDSYAKYLERLDRQAEPAPDEPVPFTLTSQAEAALDADQPEPEAEL